MTAAAGRPARAQSAPPTLETATATAPVYLTLGDTPEPATMAAAAEADTAEAANGDDMGAADEGAQPALDTASSEDEHCLAVAVYYEARGEPLAGQVAVAQVIVNRARPGRFASTLCGVVRQPGQFSFAGRGEPPANTDWRRAAAVASAVLSGGSSGPVSRAMYFHASYVAPGWNRERLATIGHHVFYR